MTVQIITLLLFHLSSAQQMIFQQANVPLSVWQPKQTFPGISSDTLCATLATSNGQCQFRLDQKTSSCEVGTSAIYQNASSPSDPIIDIYYTTGEWTAWSNWSDCSATCIGYLTGGNITRTRSCMNQGCPSMEGSASCFGPSIELQRCPMGVYCSSGRMLMVVGGLDINNSPTNSVEILDAFGAPVQNCRKVADYPFPVVGAVGIFINNQSMVCGGLGNNVYQKACYAYDYEKNVWNPTYSMLQARYFAAGDETNGKWWITGGYDGVSALSSTENYVNGSGFSAGLTLPVATFKHQLVPFWDSANTYLFFGGNDTLHQTQSWLVSYYTGATNQTSPPLFPTSYTGGVTWDNTTGQFGVISASTSGTQVFSMQNYTWYQIPTVLPVAEASPNIYVSNLFLLGGRANGTAQKSVYYRYAKTGAWTIATGQMVRARVGHTVFNVPGPYCE